jgi:hypothetical protein
MTRRHNLSCNMKKSTLKLNYTLSLFLCIGLAFSARATITGQWDFKTGFGATIGTAISPEDSMTAALTLFESTTAFGISPIAGVATNVMFFPQATDDNTGFEYEAPVGAAPNDTNEGGYFVNQYTVIMDVLFTNLPPSGKFFTLFGTDLAYYENVADGKFYVNAVGEVACSTGAGGHLTTNVWHRVAIAVDAENTSSGLEFFIDGTNVLTQGAPSGVNGDFAIESDLFLFDDPNTNSGPGFIASLQFNDVKLADGAIEELGAPVASGILTGPPPTPYVVSVSPLSDLALPALSTVSATPFIEIVLNDGTATVKTNTISLKLNGTNVTPSVTYSAPTTTISYQVTNLLAPGSLNTVLLDYQDTASDSLGTEYAFNVLPYVPLPVSAAGAPGTASVPGFIYRVAQSPSTSSGATSLTAAQAQLDGTLANSSGVLYSNEANLSGTGLQADTNGVFAGTYFIDQYEGNDGTIAFSTETPPFNLGNGGALPFDGYAFPGIPGMDTNGTINSDNFSDDVLAYIPLTAGTSYTFGVDVWGDRVDVPPDNGYVLFCGANPRDFFSTVVGQYVRTTIGSTFTTGGNTNTFTFIPPVTGVYPFRLIHWAPAPAAGGTSGAELAWYYVDPATTNTILINDLVDGTIAAYRASTIPREPYVAEVSPTPGGNGFPSTAPIVVVLSDDDLKVGSGSVKLYLDGAQVTPIITKTNTLTTVTYIPNALRTTVTNELELVYSDNATPTANFFTNNWSFTIVVAGASTPPVTGQWDFNGNLAATVGSNLLFFDGPAGYSASVITFGTCSSFGIPGINGVDAQVMYVPALANGSSEDTNYGLKMFPLIQPNGGGLKVNQYTIIYDMYYSGSVLPFFQCQNTNNANGTDGSLFLQGGDMGQGSGGYTMNHGPVSATNWHRLAFAVDLSQNLITKWVDGVKAQDWVSSANGLDAARRAWQPEVSLFSDCDGDDHTALCYVSSIQVRSGKLSDADMVLLGGPSAGKIPRTIPGTSVTGQWDFNFVSSGDQLTASVGSNLLYFDGISGYSASVITFGTCSSYGIPLINGVDAQVMYVPALANGSSEDTNYGLKMYPLIAPNGGGLKINQYTIIYDMYYDGGVLPFFQCQSTNNANGTDGSLFLQNGQMGQGSGGYNMPGIPGGAISDGWHRLAFAVDLSQNLITKWVDGVDADDWISSANGLDAPRRAWQPEVSLFSDCDGDDHTALCYVKSIQVSNGKLSAAQMMALGGPSPYGIPLAVPTLNVAVSASEGAITLSWDTAFSGFVLNSTKDLRIPFTPVSGVDYTNNTYTVPIASAGAAAFFQLTGSTNLVSEGIGNEPGLP